jgi:hypothetical protein
MQGQRRNKDEEMAGKLRDLQSIYAAVVTILPTSWSLLTDVYPPQFWYGLRGRALLHGRGSSNFRRETRLTLISPSCRRACARS